MTDRLTTDKPCLPPDSEEQRRELTGPLLKRVSRSFYLTLRVLPQEVRPQISLAYLLARASDTIADTETVARARRVELLAELRENIKAPTSRRTPSFGVRPLAAALPAEQTLLDRLSDCLQLLATLTDEDQRRISDLLHTIISGQIFDLERFPGVTEKELVALKADDELDHYTYLVAGCVGEFWTKMCQAHLKELEGWTDGKMEELGVRFGKGLQLVNVLRDVADDRRRGRQYLPNLDDYQRWLDRAVEHLDAGWRYTLAIPAAHWRLRLACIWPIWIGLKTIARLRREQPVDAPRSVKITRGEMYRLLARSVVWVCHERALDNCYQSLRRAAQAG